MYHWVDEETATDWAKAAVQMKVSMTGMPIIQGPKRMVDMPYGQRSGRTQWMINQIVAEIIDGAPSVIVIGKNWKHCDHLQRRVMDQIIKMSQLNITHKGEGIFDVEGTTLRFTPKKEMIFEDRASVFTDHTVEGEE